LAVWWMWSETAFFLTCPPNVLRQTRFPFLRAWG